MDKSGSSGNRAGREVKARRNYLGKSGPMIEEETNGEIYAKLLSQLETGKKPFNELSNRRLRALILALEWTNQEFEEKTGIAVGYAPLPDATPYVEGIRAPIYASVSAGLAPTTTEAEVKGYMGLDPNLPGLRGRPAGSLVILPVNGSSMVSPNVHESIPGGSVVIVEIGAMPQQDDVVVAWVEDREIAVLKRYNEGPEVVLSSYNPKGPVFRASEVSFDIRGVVRSIFRRP